MDAVRLSDNRTVIIKRTQKEKREGEMAAFFSTSERLGNSRNHCVPVYDCISDTVDPEIEMLVMPLLRSFNDPPFEAVGEVLDFVRQTLEVQSILLLRRLIFF